MFVRLGVHFGHALIVTVRTAEPEIFSPVTFTVWLPETEALPLVELALPTKNPSGAASDNVYIDVDNLEIPILDGSAEVFAEMIEKAGVVSQPLARRALLVRERVAFEQGNRRISVEPGDQYQIDCLIDFPHPMIGVQRFSLHLDNGAFSKEIAAARTFGFTDEIEALRRANLIRGGSLDNAIVLTPEGMLNKTGLRFRDEFVRHKILDIIGDLALLGMGVEPKTSTPDDWNSAADMLTKQREDAGLMSKLLRVRSAWDIVDMPDVRVQSPTLEIQSPVSNVQSLLSSKA